MLAYSANIGTLKASFTLLRILGASFPLKNLYSLDFLLLLHQVKVEKANIKRKVLATKSKRKNS